MIFAGISRKQAFLTHLIISMAIFFVLLYLIIFKWYPSYYFHIDGGYRGIATIFFVDVILGPGLTLLVFKPGKPNLKFDMAVIITIQIVALSWGIKSVYSERPALTVFYDGKFSCMNHAQVADVDLARLALQDKSPPLLAVLPRPSTYVEYQGMALEAYRKNSAEIYVFGEKFLPMDAVGTLQVMNYELDVADNLYGNEEELERYEKTWSDYLARNPDAREQYLFFPLSCRYGNALAAFDPEKSEIVDYVPVYTKRAASTIKLGFTPEELEQHKKYKSNNNRLGE
ncbi:MAG: hypothetical protein PVG45_07700 [Gammaproteobacteria bacterium]|jgi:hypothetical protein